MLTLALGYLLAAVAVVVYALVLFTDWPNASTLQRLSKISGTRPRRSDPDDQGKEVT